MGAPEIPTLSLCIPTLNRAAFIGQTLRSILDQATQAIEVVVCDNASTDDTEQVVRSYATNFNNIRYVRQPHSVGMDENFDFAVESARGEYCWLMPDDDLLRPGAIARVLAILERDLSLLIVNCEIRDMSLRRTLKHRCLDIKDDRVYAAGEQDRLFLDLQDMTMYAGAMIVKRQLWLQSDRRKYFGSLFLHVGVIFQNPLPGNAMVVAEPLVTYRHGNARSFTSELSALLLVAWPALVASLALSAQTRRRVRSAEPWRHPGWLLMLRGWGLYSLAEYKQWVRPNCERLRHEASALLVAAVPGVMINLLLLVYFALRPGGQQFLRNTLESRYFIGNYFARSAA
jgi:abequosyltransferase